MYMTIDGDDTVKIRLMVDTVYNIDTNMDDCFPCDQFFMEYLTCGNSKDIYL